MSADVAVSSSTDWTAGCGPRCAQARASERATRRAAVSMLPSVTIISRASLLSGNPPKAGRVRSVPGFTAFWKKRHRGAQLFHKGGYEGRRAPAGTRVPPALAPTTSWRRPQHGRRRSRRRCEGARGRWRPDDIGKLPDLLNAARDTDGPSFSSPTMAHVLDRTPAMASGRPRPRSVGARWRTGPAGEGEIRTLRPQGGCRGRQGHPAVAREPALHRLGRPATTVVPPWPNDRAGDQPWLPSADLVPEGWTLLPLKMSPRLVGWCRRLRGGDAACCVRAGRGSRFGARDTSRGAPRHLLRDCRR